MMEDSAIFSALVRQTEEVGTSGMEALGEDDEHGATDVGCNCDGEELGRWGRLEQ